MEGLVSPQGHKHSPQGHGRKSLLSATHKDLWLVVREGSLADVESALLQLKKNGSNINSRNAYGLTPLHIATWRNHIPIVRRLLEAGADPDARDGESGWTSLHRALHFGHLAVASVLLQSGASVIIEDSKSRTPVDLLSGPVLQILGDQDHSVITEIYSWGSGTNYQLGTGNAHIQKSPCKLDALQSSSIKLISASKFHSVAVTSLGELYTWGFGRGGRLGHPEFDIHSGQAAVITPRQVISGLGSRRVKAVAAAKHHTVIATESGEVFTWGSNREGQLGYASIDTQPTPRRVSSLKAKIVAVAAANKHTAAVSETGEVFTWGCNKEGQLGYGTSNSSSNNTPRLVEYLKGKVFRGVATAKYHTIVLGADGEVFTWGHRLVTPKRVITSRNLKKSGSALMKFHRMGRLHVVAVAAGMVYSMALTDDGTLFYWGSSDPDLKCHQLYSLNGRKIVSISAGKYWNSAVTSTGEVCMWDAKKSKDKPPAVTRLHGVKRATSASVGETHLLIVGSVYHPAYPAPAIKESEMPNLKVTNELGDLDEGFMFHDMEPNSTSSTCSETENVGEKLVPSLKSLCEKVAAEYLVEPRNALQMLEIADSLVADDLRKYCEEIVIRNLDYIFTSSSHAVATASPDILVHIEKLLDTRSSEPWSYRRLPTPTATFPAVINSEEEYSDNESTRTRDSVSTVDAAKQIGKLRSESFLQPMNHANQEMHKQVRLLRKKLQQIEVLEAKQLKGCALDDQQIAKLQTKAALESSLIEFGVMTETTIAKPLASVVPDGKGSKKVGSKKQKKKSKQKACQMDLDDKSGCELESSPLKPVPESNLLMSTEEKVETEPDSAVTFSSHKKDAVEAKSKGASAVPLKKKGRKGGLSMFLSGGLDEPSKVVVTPPPPPKIEGPAWGGAKVSDMPASLREIQNEQKTSPENPAKTKELEELSDDRNSRKMLLRSYSSSKPIDVVVSSQPLRPLDGDKSMPTWAASGTPPHLSRPSLRDIQMQQGKQHFAPHSPKTRTTGFSVTTGQGSPSDSVTPSRWFKPEVDSPSSIRSIQIEEKAIKVLKRYYSSVKIVRNQC